MTITILTGCCLSLLAAMPEQSVHTCVTSPPYFGLRDYGVEGQIGLEPTPDEYVATMVRVFREVRRVLRNDGTLWLNIGDSYASAWACNRRNVIGSGSLENGKREARPNRLVNGLKEKDLIGIPWRLAFALQQDGWYLRCDVIWNKPNPMPESVTDRPTRSHEYLFLLTKSERYAYDDQAIREPAEHSSIKRWQQDLDAKEGASRAKEGKKTNGKMKAVGGDKQRGHSRRHGGFNERWDEMTKAEQAALGRNKRSVWTVATKPFSEAHFATYPPELIEPCILAGCPLGGTVLDPFFGAGTTGLVADRHGRHCIGIELNESYVQMAEKRLRKDGDFSLISTRRSDRGKPFWA